MSESHVHQQEHDQPRPSDPTTLQAFYNVVVRKLLQDGLDLTSFMLAVPKEIYQLKPLDVELIRVLSLFSRICELTFQGRYAIAALRGINGQNTTVYITGEQPDKVWALFCDVWDKGKEVFGRHHDWSSRSEARPELLDTIIPHVLERLKAIRIPETLEQTRRRIGEQSGNQAEACRLLGRLEDKIHGLGEEETLSSNDVLQLFDAWTTTREAQPSSDENADSTCTSQACCRCCFIADLPS